MTHGAFTCRSSLPLLCSRSMMGHSSSPLDPPTRLSRDLLASPNSVSRAVGRLLHPQSQSSIVGRGKHDRIDPLDPHMAITTPALLFLTSITHDGQPTQGARSETRASATDDDTSSLKNPSLLGPT